MRVRLAIVATHPIQYHAPWFRHIATSMDVEVLYALRQDAQGQAAAGFGVPFEWDTSLLDDYSFRWLRNVARRPGLEKFSGCDTPELFEILRPEHFDACLILGWSHKCFVQAAAACWRNGVPLLVRGDSQLSTPRSRAVRVLKWIPYRLLLPRCAAHLYVGVRNHEYLRYYGVPDSKLFFSPHSVDNAFFADGADRARARDVPRRLRASLRIGEQDFVALFVGKLIPVKRPEDVVSACRFVETLPSGRRLHAVFVGDGPLRPRLEALAASCPGRVHFAGFRNQSEIVAWYAAADVLVLPSEAETWGLVVNEAMASGVPSVVTDTVGCAPDLIDAGRTGFTFPPGDTMAFANRLRDVEQMIQTSRLVLRRHLEAKIAQYSFDRATAGLQAALQRSSPRPSLPSAV